MTSRRAFLQNSTLCLAGFSGLKAADAEAKPLLRVGLMTDLHYADKPPTKTRFYREALAKLDEAVEVMNREKPALVVELGDFIDQADSIDREIEWLRTMESHFARLSMPRHYVLGNHCVGTLTKEEFAANTKASGSFESFEAGGVTFVILDSCFRRDGTPYSRKNFDWKDANVPKDELSWLESQLSKASGPVIVLAHQRLDADKAHAVQNAAEVRSLLEKSGKVLAVFQGHSHKNDYQQIAGIHYTTLVAMVEGSGAGNNGYAVLDVMPDGSLRLQGFRRQVERALRRA
ncbi:MAG: metallophosphoesterase [Prosthecobacter sp.]|jgi:predicted phosphodiesterase|uniref:metallophosphoesterase n=1 Tax=Prosthecobacter sp. TaxID=1965333 RepID=UPI0019E09B0A|nr:metallophosphoesterase [Prosthecobacter sp.]MBE2285441.1 metallophosphoesterase [Prosthecobacter sp.]